MKYQQNQTLYYKKPTLLISQPRSARVGERQSEPWLCLRPVDLWRACIIKLLFERKAWRLHNLNRCADLR